MTAAATALWAILGLAAGPRLATTAGRLIDTPVPGRRARAAASVALAAIWARTAFLFHGHWTEVLAVQVLLAFLLAATITDLLASRVPDALTLPGVLAGIAATSIGSYELTHDIHTAATIESRAGLAMAAYVAVFFALHLTTGIGFGDVKFSALCGLYLGWFTTNIADIALVLSRALLLTMLIGLAFSQLWYRHKSRAQHAGVARTAVGAAAEPTRWKATFPLAPAMAATTALLILLPALQP